VIVNVEKCGEWDLNPPPCGDITRTSPFFVVFQLTINMRAHAFVLKVTCEIFIVPQGFVL
jgi:hypothetical protein